MCRSIKGIVLMVCCMTLPEMLFAFQVLGNLMKVNLFSLVPFNVCPCTGIEESGDIPGKS